MLGSLGETSRQDNHHGCKTEPKKYITQLSQTYNPRLSFPTLPPVPTVLLGISSIRLLALLWFSSTTWISKLSLYY